MIFEPKQITAILKGKLTELRFEQRPKERVGHSYQVKRSKGPEVCRIEIVEKVEDAEGWVLRFKVRTEDAPRFMGRWPDYVQDRHRSIDPDAECVPEQWMDEHLRATSANWERNRGDEVDERLADCVTFEQRVVALRNIARQRSVNVRSEFRVLDRMLREGRADAAERKLNDVADQLRKAA